MANVQIISDKFTIIEGIFPKLERHMLVVCPIINQSFGQRGSLADYSYTEVFRTLR
ncbi:hypothetical protein JCM17724A_08120 [Prevotella fusca JCM 17724]